MTQGKRIFVTGGCGFIGSTLVEKLIDSNEIVVFDNMRRDALSAKEVAKHPSLQIIRGDVEDTTALSEAIKDAQIVIHCAAIAGISTVVKNPVETMRVNLLGTTNVLEAASKLPDLERVVAFSTSEVFGPHAFRADEAQLTPIGAVGEARWTYAVSKIAGEHLAHAYYSQYGMPIVVLRPFNVYGPGQVGEGALRTFVLRALNNESIEIHGDGSQIRAWCYIDDFIRGVLLCLSHPKAIGESFNIGNAKAVITIYGLAQTVVRVIGGESRVIFVQENYADVELRVPSVRKAREVLEFEAQVGLEEGILLTSQWYQNSIFGCLAD